MSLRSGTVSTISNYGTMNTKNKMIYYSDVGLEQQGALDRGICAPGYHRIRVKLLYLLSDSVLIPLSHLLSMTDNEFDNLVVKSGGLFRNHCVEFRLQEGCRDISDYIEAFRSRPNADDLNLDSKKRLLSELGIKATPSICYSGDAQTALFRSMMSSYIQKNPRRDIPEDVSSKLEHIVRNSANKREFDIGAASLLSNYPVIDGIVRDASNAMYYLVGAATNQSSVSANGFFNGKTLSRLGLDTDSICSPITGELLDPNAFTAFLIYSNAISEPADIDELSYRELISLKKEEEYQAFAKLYRTFFRQAKKLTDLIDRFEWENALSSYSRGMLFVLLVAVARHYEDPQLFDAVANSLDGALSDVVRVIPKLIDLAGDVSTLYAIESFIPGRRERGPWWQFEKLMHAAGGSILPLTTITERINGLLRTI